MFNSLMTLVGKRFFPGDDAWEQKRKLDTLLWGAAIGLGLIGLIGFYGFLVAHIFLKTGGHL